MSRNSTGRWDTKNIWIVLAVLLVFLPVAPMQRMKERTAGKQIWGNSTILPASVKAGRVTAVVAAQAGILTGQLAAPGDKVEAGQEIATLENPALASALAEARVLTAAARSRFEQVRRGGSHRLLSEQAGAAEKGAVLTCSRAEQFNLQKLVDAQRAAAMKLEELIRLREKQIATSAEVDRQRMEEQNASQALINAREVESRLRQECEASRAQAGIVRLQLELERKAAVEQAKAEWEAAVLREKEAEQRLGSLRVVSREAGTLLSFSVPRGEWVPGGAVVAHVGDTSELAVEVPVGARIAKVVKKGDSVGVRLPTDPPREVAALIHAVVLSPQDEEHPYVVRVQLKNPEPESAVAGLQGAVIFRHVLESR